MQAGSDIFLGWTKGSKTTATTTGATPRHEGLRHGRNHDAVLHDLLRRICGWTLARAHAAPATRSPSPPTSAKPTTSTRPSRPSPPATPTRTTTTTKPLSKPSRTAESMRSKVSDPTRPRPQPWQPPSPTRPLDADLVPVRPGLPRGLVIAVRTAAVLVAALGLQPFAEIVGPVFLALLLSIVVQPVRRFPARHGLPAWLGTALSLVAVYAMVVGLVAILVISGVQLAGLLTDYQPQFEATVKSLSTKLEAAGISQAQLQAVASQANPGKIVGLVADLLGGVAGILGSITSDSAAVLHRHRRRHFCHQRRPHLPRRPTPRGDLPTLRHRQPPIPGRGHHLRRRCRPARCRRLVHPRHPLRLAVGPAGLHHQLHPQCRLHHRTRPADHRRPRRPRR